MKKYGKQRPIRFDKKELKEDLGSGKFIFVGSSCDVMAENIPDEWIKEMFLHTQKFDNQYLFQSKNPGRFLKWHEFIHHKSVICTTIESDSFYPEIMRNSPHPMERSIAMNLLSDFYSTYVTIEPIMDFHLEHFVTMIKRCNAKQVNVGADSQKKNLPEPTKEKILELIYELGKFTVVLQKTNLKRLLK
jgi:hypothetical protein